ncbi:MAG: transposase [Pyrinomonadaceae bacterium]|nr:transposase [Pyrinomonadaceae bacterium]
MNPINHSQMLIHVIFSTKNQQSLISKEIEPLLYDKISKILYDECYSPALIIGGGVEYIHIILAQSRDWSVDALVNRVKTKTVEFMRKRIENFDWQEGYGAFSISRSEDEFEKKYIAEQKKFHQTVSYKDEFREFLKRHEIEYDEDEVWE